MSWRGILRRAGILSNGKDVTIDGFLRASNIVNTRGSIFYVDSVNGTLNNGGKSPRNAKISIKNALTNCTANNGDFIIALAGHQETIVSAGDLDLSVAGVTIIAQGFGADKATITFTTAVTASMTVTADDIAMTGFRYVAGIDALTGPISITAANCLVEGEWYDAPAMGTTDCIVATAAAIGLVIPKWKYVESTTGTQKQSHIQLNGVDNAVLGIIDIRGDFGTGNVENVTDEVLNIRLEGLKLNNLSASPTPALVLDANSTGWAKNVKLRVASGTTYTSSVAKVNWDNECEGFSTDGAAGEPLGTVSGTSIEGKVDQVLAQQAGAAGVATYPAGAAAGNAVSMAEVLRYLQENVITGTGTALPANQSLYDLLAGAKGIAAFPAGAAAANDVSIAEVVRYIQENIQNGGTALPAVQSLYDVLAGANGLATWATGAAPANGVSIAEALRYVIDALVGTTGMAAFPAGAAAANDVSLAEVLRYLQENVITGTGTVLPADQSLYDLIAGAKGIAAFPAGAAAANDVSVAEVLRYVQEAAPRNIATGVVDLTSGTVADMFTITGGPVAIESFIGEFQVACSANACAAKLIADPTNGADTDMCATIDLSALTQYSFLTIDGTIANAMVNAVPATALPLGIGMDVPLILPIGTVDFNLANSDLTDGTIIFYVRYRPLVNGAVMTAT